MAGWDDDDFEVPDFTTTSDAPPARDALTAAGLLPGALAKYSFDYVFLRAKGTRVEFATLCGHTVKVEPLAFAKRAGGHREALSVRITAESADWRAEWSHAVRSSAVNNGGTDLGLVVFEQLSMHNLTLIDKRNSRSRVCNSFLVI